jgi:hypothetical protein
VTDLGLPAVSGSSARTIDVTDACIRSILFVGVFLIVWISFQPFQNLAEPPIEVTEGGSRVNRSGFRGFCWSSSGSCCFRSSTSAAHGRRKVLRR